MYDVLTVAGGVLLAFYTLRVIDFVISIPARKAQKRKAEEFHNFMSEMATDLVKHLEESEKKKPTRRKPATKKKGSK